MISNEELKKILEFSKLDYSASELESLKAKIQESVELLETLKEVDVDGIEPLFRVFEYEERLREDLYLEEMSLTRDEVLQNTSEKEYGFFKLKNIME